jgi:TP901 family phage tail tape measure protein
MNIAALTIPAIFTAIDNLTQPFRAMNRAVSGFGNNLAVVAARADRIFNNMLPSLSDKTKEVIDYAKGVASVATAMQLIRFTGKSIMDYEDAIASFRTIVSDLSNVEFSKFTDEVSNVANKTRRSTIDVAKSFEVIAGLNADFAKTAEGLGGVSEAVITLAKAGRMELGKSAENLIGIMNQFNFTVEESNRTINVLAAGQAVGAASISQTADALTNFGAVAKSANITIEQSVGLIQLLAGKGQLGAEAGSRLRAAIVKLQAAGVGYSSGVFNITDALTELKKQYDALRTPMERDAMLTKTFGLESITTGSILLNNIGVFNEFTKSVTGTSEAQKAAEINSATLINRLNELVNKFVNYITTLHQTSTGLQMVTGFVGWLTDNMGWLLDIAIPLIGAILAVKTVIWGMATAAKIAAAWTWALEFAAGVAAVTNGTFATSCFASSAGMYGMAVAAGVAEAAQWLLNYSLLGFPILWIIAGVALLIAIIVKLVSHWDKVKEAFANNGFIGALKEIGKVLLDLIITPIDWIITAIAKITKADWAVNGMNAIDAFRANLGVETVDKTDTKAPLPALSTRVTEQNTLFERIEQSSQKEKIELSYNNMPSNVNVSATSGIAVRGTTTMMGGNV